MQIGRSSLFQSINDQFQQSQLHNVKQMFQGFNHMPQQSRNKFIYIFQLALFSPFGSFYANALMTSQSVDHFGMFKRDQVITSQDRFAGNSIGLMQSFDGGLNQMRDQVGIYQHPRPESPVFKQRMQVEPLVQNEVQYEGTVEKKVQKKPKLMPERIEVSDDDDDLDNESEGVACKKQLRRDSDCSWKMLKKSKRVKKQNQNDVSERSKKQRRKKKGSKVNDTKNITKNFSKAIISYIIQNKNIGLQILRQNNERYDEFVCLLKKIKNSMTNIKQLRELWVDNSMDEKQREFNRAFRIIRYELASVIMHLQIASISQNAKLISNTSWHLKYRQNLLRALREPDNFKFIKDI